MRAAPLNASLGVILNSFQDLSFFGGVQKRRILKRVQDDKERGVVLST